MFAIHRKLEGHSRKGYFFVLNILISIHWFIVYQLQITDILSERNQSVPDTRYTYRGCGKKNAKLTE